MLESTMTIIQKLIYQACPLFILVILLSCAHLPEKPCALQADANFSNFFDQSCKPKQPVVDLLALSGFQIPSKQPSPEIIGILPEQTPLKSYDFRHVLQLVQGKGQFGQAGSWIRPTNKERWEIKSRFSDAQDEAIVTIFKRLGFFKENSLIAKRYAGALVLGARFSNTLERLNLVEALQERGTEFEKIYLLSGERELTGEEIAACQKMGLKLSQPDERNMMFLLSQHILKSNHNLVHVDANKKPNAKRATTADTIEAFAEQDPSAGKYALISTQPFGLYQLLVTQKELQKNQMDNLIKLKLSTQKLPHPENEKAEVLLDNLARIFYVYAN